MDEQAREDAGARSFEEELGNLEKVVRLLESGGLDLEEALRQYESGHASLRRCRDILERSRRRIEILSGPLPEGCPGQEPERGEPAWRPLDLPEGPPDRTEDRPAP
jgi:exodeoxyribonuclease VII small subunit